jgi:hypothetical protein
MKIITGEEINLADVIKGIGKPEKRGVESGSNTTVKTSHTIAHDF